MRRIMEEIWREMCRKMSSEQVMILSLLLAFIQYYGKSAGLQRYESGFSREALEQEMEDIEGYDLRVALHRLCESINWNVLEDEELQQYIEDVMRIFAQYQKENADGLAVLYALILEMADRNREYQITPASVQKLIVDLMGTKKVCKLAELCCGGAGLGMALWDRLAVRNEEVVFHGEEKDRLLCDIARVNLFVHHILNGEILERDVLDIPNTDENQSYDMIVMDVPRGRNITELYNYNDPRLLYFNKKNIYPDWIFIQDVLYRLSKEGSAAVLVTAGALVRMNEEILRRQVIVNDWLEAVITLPFNLYPKQYTGTELLIFNKNKPAVRRDKVIFIDISQECYGEGSHACEITKRGINLAREIFWGAKEVEGISAVCDKTKLEEEYCSFKPIQYIHHAEEWEFDSNIVLEDIAEVIRGAQVARKTDVIEKGGAYFINIKDIRDKRLRLENADHVSRENSVCKEKYKIRQEDILITSKGTALKLAIVEDSPPEAYISGNITMIRVNRSKYNPYVLFEYLNSKQGQIALERIQSGTTIRILSNASLKKLKIPQYNETFMEEIGGQLKRNQLDFYREERLLRERFENERHRLLKKLEVPE